MSAMVHFIFHRIKIFVHTSLRDFRVYDWLKDHTWPCINSVHGPANNRYLLIFGTIYRNRYDFFLINVNPILLKLIILSWCILTEKYNISANVKLKNSKCVCLQFVVMCPGVCTRTTIVCVVRMSYTHNAHPCFGWYIPSKSSISRNF